MYHAVWNREQSRCAMPSGEEQSRCKMLPGAEQSRGVPCPLEESKAEQGYTVLSGRQQIRAEVYQIFL
jgi:hypothetical protein